MEGYAVARPLELRTQREACRRLPAQSLDSPEIDRVYLAAPEELRLVHAALDHQYPGIARKALLRVHGAPRLATMPGFPAQLGAAGAGPQAPPGVLAVQARQLRARHADRRQFRLLLVNGFGSNLGDALIGLTAFRHVREALRAEWPEVSADTLIGWQADERLERLLAGAPGIDRVLGAGPTLAELAGYQGYFDTTGLITLPRYDELPPVDWLLWWFGLDPAAIPGTEKRNAYRLEPRALEEVETRLPTGCELRIVVNPKASTPLRSMPEVALRRLVAAALARWPRACILCTQPLRHEDARVFDLSSALPTTDHLAALLSLADGLIGVDTFTQHLADATGTPAATIFTTLDPARFPYYPLGQGVLLPDARALPAWGRHKTSPEFWANVERAYAAAWERLSTDAVLEALTQAMARKPKTALRVAPLALAGRRDDACPTTGVPPSRRREDPRADVLWRTLIRLGEQVLRRGDTAAVLGAGEGEAALELARRVGPRGRLVAFEPRRALCLQLCARLREAGIRHAEVHAALPVGEAPSLRWIDGLDPDDEYWPLRLGNSQRPEPVICWPLDLREIEDCRLLAVCAPLPLAATLRGARATIDRARPTILAGPVHRRDEASVAEALAAASGYQLHCLELGELGRKEPPRYFLLVAEPR